MCAGTFGLPFAGSDLTGGLQAGQAITRDRSQLQNAPPHCGQVARPVLP